MRLTTLGLLVLAALLLAPMPGRVLIGDEEESTGGLAVAKRNEMLWRAYHLNQQVVKLWKEGRSKEAEPLAREVLSLRERALAPDHPSVAHAALNLGAQLSAQQRLEEARALYERALRVYEKAYGPDHPDVAWSLNNLAFVLASMGQYETARQLYVRALRIREKALGPEHPAVAESLHNLAYVFDCTGQLEQARVLSERALQVTEKVLGPEHRDVALRLDSLASVVDSLGHHEQARSLLERALRIREEALGPEHADVAVSLNNLAGVVRSLGQHEQARAHYERARRIFEEQLGSDHTCVAGVLTNLAVLLWEEGRNGWARSLCERAIRIYERTFGSEDLRVANAVGILGKIHWAAGQYERANSLWERSLKIVEQHARRRFAGLQVSERLALLQQLREYLDTWLLLAPDLGRSGYAEVMRFKGLVARSASAERRLARKGGAEVVQRVREYRAAERRLSQLANAPPSGYPAEGREERMTVWREAYAKAGAEREALALALAGDFAPLREGLERFDLTLQDIQAHLLPDAVLLDYLRAGDRYVAWITRREGKAERIDLGAARDIEAAAVEFAEKAGDSDDDDAMDRAGKALRVLIFTPIEERLGKDARTLYLCPDAALAAVPFAALPGKEAGRRLIDDYVMIMVSMAQDLVPWKGAGKVGKGALLLGGVDYGKASESTQRASGPQPRPLASVDRAPRSGCFVSLPGTRQEVGFVQARLGRGATALLGGDATEARFRASAKGRRILHLATHGFVRDDLMRGLNRPMQDREWLGADMERQLARGHDPMLLAGLAMAGANPRQGGHGDDGILTALEASHLDLDGVELVVLSACQTALGRAESGQGVIGLVQGFQMAGSLRVICSLWEVDDAATRALMVRFYELWNPEGGMGLGAAAALRQAQAFVRAHEEWRHPYYWAGWVLWGLPE